MMKERPIIFSTDMVKAILEGRKTQTRRIVKPQPQNIIEHFSPTLLTFICGVWAALIDNEVELIKCPYGLVGKRLWVRETWGLYFVWDNTKPSDIPTGVLRRAKYKADADTEIGYTWRPSIFMPRRASRITLEIMGVRVERLQEISKDDALAEGVLRNNPCGWIDELPEMFFKSLWDSINAKRGYGWDTNPWVWVLEFKLASKGAL